jgi:signal transduction histidine kinase
MDGDTLVLTVEDNGVGIPEGVRSHRGMVSMKTRAELLGGSIAWDAVVPHGCRVVLRMSFPDTA